MKDGRRIFANIDEIRGYLGNKKMSLPKIGNVATEERYLSKEKILAC